MPILAMGRFQAQVQMADSVLLEHEPGSFFFFPTILLVRILGVVFLLLILRGYWMSGRNYSFSRHTVMLPILVGILLLRLENAILMILGISLQSVSWIVILWCFPQFRKWMASAVVAFLAAFAVSAWTIAFLEDSSAVLPFALPVWTMDFSLTSDYPIFMYQFSFSSLSLIFGAATAAPIYMIRLLMTPEMPGRKLKGGLILGALSSAVISLLFLGRLYFIMGLAYGLLCGLVLLALIHWNDWARDVVSGNLRRPEKRKSG